MDWSKLSEQERLAAEQAVLTVRALNQAADQAPHGHGLACLEAVIADKGLQHLRGMLQQALASRPEAQKRGSAASGVPAAGQASSSASSRGRS